MLTQADSKQHYFETAAEHEISSANIYTIILTFSYDFIALTVLSFDTKQNKNIRQGTDCLVFLLPSSLTQRRTVLNKQTSVKTSYPGTPCNPPCRTGSAFDNMYTLFKFNHSKSEIADMTSILSHQGRLSFKCKQSKVLEAVGQLGCSVH